MFHCFEAFDTVKTDLFAGQNFGVALIKSGTMLFMFLLKNLHYKNRSLLKKESTSCIQNSVTPQRYECDVIRPCLGRSRDLECGEAAIDTSCCNTALKG